jgi:hypothetical protein
MPTPRLTVQNNLEGPPRPYLADGVSGTPSNAIDEPQDRTERVHRWTAALVTALVHGLLFLLMLSEPPITVTPPAGGSGGSRIDVTLLDDSTGLPPAEPEPPAHKPVPRKKPKAPHAIKRPLSTPVVQATEPLPPEAPDNSTAPPTPAPEPPDARRDTAEVGFPTNRRPDDAAQANAALAAKLGSSRGQSNTAPPVGPNMGVDGFHVYYDLVNETRLRAWRDQGMTELFLPLPGTRRLMVCPLEVALRRGSGACHMVELDSPELKNVGDAREVIDIQRVYQLGDMVWSGPGPYR